VVVLDCGCAGLSAMLDCWFCWMECHAGLRILLDGVPCWMDWYEEESWHMDN